MRPDRVYLSEARRRFARMVMGLLLRQVSRAARQLSFEVQRLRVFCRLRIKQDHARALIASGISVHLVEVGRVDAQRHLLN